MNAYTPYEQTSLREARAMFADPYRTPVSALVNAVDESSRRAGRRAMVGHLSRVASLFAYALDVGIGVAFRTLDSRAAYRSFRRHGLRVSSPRDVARLELWEVDEVTERLPQRYMAAGAALGVVSASLGRFGVALDAPLVVALAARAIGDYAIHYGFDPSDPEEQAFARAVLVAALTPAKNVHAASIEELVIAAVAGARAWRKRAIGLGAPALVRLARRVLSAGLSRQTRASLSRLGGTFAAALNAWLVFGVIRAARSAYRERFLAARSASEHDAFCLMGRIATQRGGD